MRYSSIRNMDISNGENIGVSLFVQGCPFHCYNCFNSDTWDFNGGKEWTKETKNKFLKLIDRPYIKRVSLLGGECLAEQNLSDVLSLVKEIRLLFPEKTIWLYTGFRIRVVNMSNYPSWDNYFETEDVDMKGVYHSMRSEILNSTDVIVDGEYIDEQLDVTLRWRGSRNQRVIDVQKSLEQGKVVLYCD